MLDIDEFVEAIEDRCKNEYSAEVDNLGSEKEDDRVETESGCCWKSG